jgi:hypothetical protein
MIQARAPKDQRVKPTSRKITVAAPYAAAKGAILNGIARTHGVQSIRHSGSEFYTLIGFESDLDVVEILFASLHLQALNGVEKARPSRGLVQRYDAATGRYADGVTAGDVKAFRRAFILGFAQRVSERLRETQREAQANSEAGTDLVLVDRKAAVDSLTKELFPKVVTRKTYARGDGYRSGQAAGSRANLGTTGIGSGRGVAIGR